MSFLIQLYRKKRVLLESAETKARIAVAQSRKEVELASAAYHKLRKIEEILTSAEEHVKAVDLLARKHLPRKHTAHKLFNSLSGLRTLHDETREIVSTLAAVKAKAHRNIEHLCKDFGKITSIRKKMYRQVG